MAKSGKMLTFLEMTSSLATGLTAVEAVVAGADMAVAGVGDGAKMV